MSKRMKRTSNGPSEGTLDSGLVKFGTKLGLSLIVMVAVLTLLQCTVKTPKSPTWDTQLTVPLINRTYEMTEIIDKMDQDGIALDVDSAIVFSVSEPIDTVTVDADAVATDDISYLAVQQLGLIDIPAPSVAPVMLDIMLIGGLAAYLPGSVPATSFNITVHLPVITEFTDAQLTSAGAWVIVSNNLGFAITADSVELWDVTYNRSIGRRTFPVPIADGDVDSVLYDLSGQTISNTVEARILANTMGGVVLSTAGKNLTTAFRFDSDLTVVSATAEIPAQNHDFSSAVTLGETDAVYRATLTGGSLQLDIGNQTNLTATLNVTFPDLLSGGSPVTIQRTVMPISLSTVALDLTGYELMPIDSTVPQDININVTATVPGTAPQHVTVDQLDQFIVNASLSNLTFGEVGGVFAAVTSTFTDTRYDIEVPDGFDSISLVSAVLTLDIQNAIEMPGNLTITLLGDNGKVMTLSGAIAPATADSAVVTRFIDSGVADFLSPVPSQITVSGDATFGDGVTEGLIRAGDYITAGIDILAPLEIIIPETTVQPDIESEEIDQEDIDVITDHVLEARLIYNVINRMPVGATINVFLGGDSATVISNPEASFVGEIFVIGAPTTASIATDTVSTGYQSVTIDSADLHVLENETLYIGTQLVLEDTQGQPVKLMANDYITIIGRIEVDYRFTGDF